LEKYDEIYLKDAKKRCAEVVKILANCIVGNAGELSTKDLLSEQGINIHEEEKQKKNI